MISKMDNTEYNLTVYLLLAFIICVVRKFIVDYITLIFTTCNKNGEFKANVSHSVFHQISIMLQTLILLISLLS